jgi:chromosome segregation ATPase
MDENHTVKPLESKIQYLLDTQEKVTSLQLKFLELSLKAHQLQAEIDYIKNTKAFYLDENPIDSSLDQTLQIMVSSMKLPKQFEMQLKESTSVEKKQIKEALNKKLQENATELKLTTQKKEALSSELNDIQKKREKTINEIKLLREELESAEEDSDVHPEEDTAPEEFQSMYPAMHNNSGMFLTKNDLTSSPINETSNNNKNNTSSSSTTTTNSTPNTPGSL